MGLNKVKENAEYNTGGSGIYLLYSTVQGLSPCMKYFGITLEDCHPHPEVVVSTLKGTVSSYKQ